jgi:hypothetical protein
MNPDRHAQSHWDFYQHLVKGDDESAEQHRKFYDEYNAVLDMPADYYLETIKTVFQEFHLPKGTWEVEGKLVRPQDIKTVALFTVEGELDDISGAGQTQAARALQQHSGKHETGFRCARLWTLRYFFRTSLARNHRAENCGIYSETRLISLPSTRVQNGKSAATILTDGGFSIVVPEICVDNLGFTQRIYLFTSFPVSTSIAAQIEDLLPQTQCTKCGYPSCHLYATAIASGEASYNQCPPGGQQGVERLAHLLGQP